MNVNIPFPSAEAFDEAARGFDQVKPKGTRIAGLAIIKFTAQLIFWSVNYEVDDSSQFPLAKVENCVAAKAKLQSVAPHNTAVHQVCVCEIKPGGLALRKWQVQYSVQMRAQGERTTYTHKSEETKKVRSLPKVQKQQQRKQIPSEKKNLTSQIRPITFDTKFGNSRREASDVIERVANLMKKQIAEVRQTRKKYSDLFVTKSNVFRYTPSEINTWFSERKRNFTFGLRRIMAKQQKKAQEIRKTEANEGQNQSEAQLLKRTKRKTKLKPVQFVKGESTVKDSIPVTTPRALEKYAVVAPGDLYQSLEARRIMQRLQDVTHKDKMKVLASIAHVSQCSNENHTPRCVRASEILRRFECVADKQTLDKVISLALDRYKISHRYLQEVRLYDKSEQEAAEKATSVKRFGEYVLCG